MLSLLLEKNLKSQIANILIRGQSRTAKQIVNELKKKGINVTARGVYKSLNELLKKKVIIKYETSYEINPEWISEIGKDSNQALKKMLDKNSLGIHASELKEMCSCNHGYTEGFCELCQWTVCSHCGSKEIRHINCEASCINCQCGHHEGTCVECGKPSCLRCGKEMWVHEHQFCNKKEKKANIGIVEVDHECWFSNLSEKHHEPISLNSFSDEKDRKIGTHSGIIKIEMEDKRRAIRDITKQSTIREARLVHKTDKTYYIRTRASINKSVDEFTKSNSSILLNPIIANDSKEKNLIISPSQKEMRRLAKGLQEFGGKARIITTEDLDMNNLDKINNKKISGLLEKVPKKELLNNLQKMRLLK